MSRWWALLPLAIAAAIPIWTDPVWPVIAVVAVGCILCAGGVGLNALAPVTAGALFAIIGYTAALELGNGNLNVVAATVFGLALLSLLDVSEFARRFRGAEVAAIVPRRQLVYWLGRGVAIIAAMLVLMGLALLLSLQVPSGARAAIAGLGALIAFAAALYAGIIPTETAANDPPGPRNGVSRGGR
jgi:hypothetical protein